MSVNDVRLVLDGYTVSTPTATFARVGDRYVMRDKRGHRVDFPLNAYPDHMRAVWIAFESAAAGEMPAKLLGEIVRSGSKGSRRGESARVPDLPVALPARDSQDVGKAARNLVGA